MTLQTNAHPKLAPVFENGARRVDYDAVIEIFFEQYPGSVGSVSAFYDVALELEMEGADYKQMARVLKQKADRGEVYVFTNGGRYFYGKPRDGVLIERFE